MAGLSSSRCNNVNLVSLLVLVPFSLQIGFDTTPPLYLSLIFYLNCFLPSDPSTFLSTTVLRLF